MPLDMENTWLTSPLSLPIVTHHLSLICKLYFGVVTLYIHDWTAGFLILELIYSCRAQIHITRVHGRELPLLTALLILPPCIEITPKVLFHHLHKVSFLTQIFLQIDLSPSTLHGQWVKGSWSEATIVDLVDRCAQSLLTRALRIDGLFIYLRLDSHVFCS